MTIPKSFEEITPDWLTGALRSSGHLERGNVLANSVQRIGEDTGFASEVARIRLTFDLSTTGVPSSLVVKVARNESYGREAHFYSLISPDSGIRTPKCYYSAYERGQIVLLLEDLTSSRFGDAAIGWSFEDAIQVVRALATFHVKWWNHRKLDLWEWLPGFGDSENQMAKLVRRRETFLKRYGREVSPDLSRLTMNLDVQHVHLIERLARPPCTLLHVDTHPDNIAFIAGAETSEPVFFDWQGICKGRSAVDLSAFLSAGSVVERRAGERQLIREYHAQMVACGVHDYSIQELQDDYRVALLRWWIGTVNGLGSSNAKSWAGRQAELARRSVLRWNAINEDHHLSDLL